MCRLRSILIVILLVGPAFLSQIAAGTTYYVSPCGNDGWAGTDPNCLSPSGAKATIQAAIYAADEGDMVMVACGTYFENIDFEGKDITVSSTNPDDPMVVANTTIQGNGCSSVVTFANGEGPSAVLSGFTITGGYGTVVWDISNEIYWGAGIFCYQSSPTIISNVITGNSGPRDVGEFVRVGYGGGICSLESNAVIKCNIITGNEAYVGGGVMDYVGNDTFASNVIYDNNADLGGGVCLVYGGKLFNNTISANSSPNGGNIYAFSEGTGSPCEIINNIIANSIGGHGIRWDSAEEHFVIAYNNFWDNDFGDYYGMPDQTGLNGNIAQDPLFVDPVNYDYHLQSNSPCINAGDPEFPAAPGEEDIDGGDRVFAGRIDIGADEYVGYIKPIADAGPDQHLFTIQQVTLDGSGSYLYCDPNILRFQWTQTAGPTIQLSDATAVMPTFMPLAEDKYLFELVVSDGIDTSGPDEVLIVVGNHRPIADAGPDMVCRLGRQATLDGSGSYDPDPADELSYMWTQVAGPTVVLTDADTTTPYFDCTTEGLYEFELIVSDGYEDSEPSVVRLASAVGVITYREYLDVSAPLNQHYPDISGDVVAYGNGSACDYSCDIFCRDVVTGAPDSFGFAFPGLDTQPKIDGQIIVWVGGPVFVGYPGGTWGHEPSNVGVLARNITTGTQKTLGQYTMSESYSHPAVSGNKVVWLEHLNLDTTPLGSLSAANWYDTPYNIRGADISDLENPIFFPIADNVGNRDPYAFGSNTYYYADFDSVIDISGDIVVWEAQGDIYGADISDLGNITVFTICDDPAYQYDPAICEDTVLWCDLRHDGGDIYGADISDRADIEIFAAVKKPGSQKEPAINGGLMAYVEVEDGLYYGIIKICSLTKHYGVLPMPLGSVEEGMAPAIDGEYIVWQSNDYWEGRAVGWWVELAYSIADGPIENITTGKKYDYIQHAINDALDGDEIVVSAGVYRENIDLKGKNIILRSPDPDDPAVIAGTIIEGTRFKAVVTIASGENENCHLSGFTITGGNNQDNGGGVSCIGTSPTINNCIIRDNISAQGAGLSNDGGTLTINNCIFSGNVTSAYGGGGIYNNNFANITISNCIFADNSGGGGGGIANYNSSSAVVTNCTFFGNNAYKATSGGGAFRCHRSSDMTISNCISWANSGVYGSEICITSNSTLTIAYSDVRGGFTGVYVPSGSALNWNAGNINIDPELTDPNNDEFHLMVGSPCIEAGDPNYIAGPNEVDMDGEPRIMNSRVDMGADEFRPASPDCWFCPSQCNGDANCDYVVNTDDWPSYRDSFEKSYPDPDYNPCGDFDRDGIVDTNDWPAFRDNFQKVPAADCALGGTWPPF